MEEELKAVNDTEIEKTIAEAFEKLVGVGCKCKIVSRLYINSRSYINPGKTVFKIEIEQIGDRGGDIVEDHVKSPL